LEVLLKTSRRKPILSLEVLLKIHEELSSYKRYNFRSILKSDTRL
jgi:hypothetical protein